MLRTHHYLCLACLALTSCGGDASHQTTTPAPTEQVPQPASEKSSRTYTLNFAGMVGDQPVACDATYENVGQGQTAVVKDFRFYVHGFELIRADGTSEPLTLDNEDPWQRDGVALLDFEAGCESTGTKDTRTLVRGTAKDDTYTGLRFVLGVPFNLDHLDRSSAAAPLNLTKLFWDWQNGYIFSRVDLNQGFQVHLGSTGCSGHPELGDTVKCLAPNLVTITFDQFNIDHDVVVADVATLVAGADLTKTSANPAPGCMSDPDDPECKIIMPHFAHDYFRKITR